MSEFTTYQSRKCLGEMLPLDTPLSIHCCATTFCNFHCQYCVHSLAQGNILPNGLKKIPMTMEIFEKLLNDLKEFPQKLRLFNFAYLGEPLLNSNIVEMVELAKKAEVSERVEIVTNASMLTRKLSERLVEAGLDRLRISIQGLTEREYYEMSKCHINYKEFIENIRYFYKISRGTNTRIYIKTVDSQVATDERKNIFRELFEDCCDWLNVEQLIPISAECDLSMLKAEFKKSFWGGMIENNNICSEVFYTLVVTPEGDIYPCCTMGQPPVVLGNVMIDDVKEVWNGKALNQLRLQMLKEGYNSFLSCKDCGVVKYQIAETDYLGKYKDKLLKLYREK